MAQKSHSAGLNGYSYSRRSFAYASEVLTHSSAYKIYSALKTFDVIPCVRKVAAHLGASRSAESVCE